MLSVREKMPPELTVRLDVPVLLVLKVVSLAVRVPLTSIACELEQHEPFSVTVSPTTKLTVPLSLNVCPG